MGFNDQKIIEILKKIFMSKKNLRLVSVIIPTKNSAKAIESCLKSIQNQSYKNIEIIVVDQESKDGTGKIASQFGGRVITVPRPKFYTPPSTSRNIGAKEAKGEILYHLDSDMKLSRGLIKEIVNRFSKDSKFGALIVHEKDVVGGFWSKCKALERRCCWGNDRLESARVVKKSIFEKVGGYDINISSGEDFDIHRKYKNYGEIGFCKNVVYHNIRNLTFAKQIKKKYNYGKTAKVYFNKHQGSGFSIVNEEFGSYLKNYKLFLKDPIVGAGVIILKVCEFLAGSVGILTSSLSRQ